VAFDGVLADTLIAREAALTEGALAVGLVNAMPELPVHWIAGRSWREAVRQLALLNADVVSQPAPNASAANTLVDETLLDLTEHAAENAFTRVMANSTPLLDMSAVALCRQAVELGWRLILRADSTRRSGEEIMRFAESETGASRLLTGDDPGVLHAGSVVLSQYAGIISIAAGRRAVSSVELGAVWERMESAIGGYVQRGWPHQG